MTPRSLALLEVANLAPALLVADRVAKAANVEILGIESTDAAAQCIKLAGPVSAVREAAEQGAALAKLMGAASSFTVLAGPLMETIKLATRPPAFSPLLGV